jgi:hypothetical protein
MKKGYQLEANYLCEVVHTAPLAVGPICLRYVPSWRKLTCARKAAILVSNQLGHWSSTNTVLEAAPAHF